jgi:xanthine dehydrogenase molybdopterin-binding subunit B
MPAVEKLPVSPVERVRRPSALGQNIPRREGAAKLCGQACFVGDLPRDGVWFGATVRADVPHARLLGIRFDPRFDWKKVVVATARDIPGANVVPVVLRDQPSRRACGFDRGT